MSAPDSQGTAVPTWREPVVHADAHALSAFRILPDKTGREYTATWWPGDPWGGCERFIRMCRAVGWLADEGDGYAVLDVLNEDGDIVQDFVIPTRAAFNRIKRKLDWRVQRA